jgi:hypothetical protein
MCLVEIGGTQVEGVREAASATLADWTLAVHDDLAGLPRVVELAPTRSASETR